MKKAHARNRRCTKPKKQQETIVKLPTLFPVDGLTKGLSHYEDDGLIDTSWDKRACPIRLCGEKGDNTSADDRWNKEHFGYVPFKSEDNGQLTLEFDCDEPPDPDDFATLQEFESAWQQWEKYLAPSLKSPVLRGEDEEIPLSTPIPTPVLRGEDEEIPLSTPIPTPVLRGEDEEIPRYAKRKKGEGTGRIQWRSIVKPSGKTYWQAWYDYEVWRGGEILTKKTKYIPKRLIATVQQMEVEKAPVREILQLLGVII